MRNDSSSEKRHPIQVVARRTGMTADRLRAWEKRYAVVEPARSEGGRRLYSDDDIEMLRLLHRAILGGRRISRVASLDLAALSDLVHEDEEAESKRPASHPGDIGGTAESYCDTCMELIEGFDAQELAAVLGRALTNLGVTAFIESVASPLINRVGERVRTREFFDGHQQLAAQALRAIAFGLIKSSADPAAAAVVAGTPFRSGELAALLGAAAVSSQGARVTYLGGPLSASEIARVARSLETSAVLLGTDDDVNETELESTLRTLIRVLPEGVEIIVVGGTMTSSRGSLRDITQMPLDGSGRFHEALGSL